LTQSTSRGTTVDIICCTASGPLQYFSKTVVQLKAPLYVIRMQIRLSYCDNYECPVQRTGTKSLCAVQGNWDPQ